MSLYRFYPNPYNRMYVVAPSRDWLIEHCADLYMAYCMECAGWVMLYAEDFIENLEAYRLFVDAVSQATAVDDYYVDSHY